MAAMQTEARDKMAFTQNALTALNDIDRALAYHMQWLQELHHSLICRAPVKPELLADDAHEQCLFGRWYTQVKGPMAEQTGFAVLGERHRGMHEHAQILLLKQMRGEAIEHADYDAFMRAAQDFRGEAQKFQSNLINLVCVIDHLTGAWNRFAMVSKIAEERERMQRTGQPCCLCILDLDHFKNVNDNYGHLAGDLALQAVVRFLTARIRRYDYVFRYGGEEFLLCLPNTTLSHAETLLDRMRHDLANTPIDIGKGATINITASFGVTEMLATEHHEDCIERADHALLCAKAKGRNRVCSWPLHGGEMKELGD
jgi:diguanylate cyclase (GGDEF)-like protein